MEERKKERKINRKKFTVKSYIFMEEKKTVMPNYSATISKRQWQEERERERESGELEKLAKIK